MDDSQNANRGKPKKRFDQINLQNVKNVFAQLIELFMGYKTAYSVSLYVAKRAAQNRYYEKQCFESGAFLIILMLIRYHSIVICWESSLHTVL
jgi:hypothetical protein